MRFLLIALAASAVGFAVAAGAQRAPEGRLVFATVHSRALEMNLLGDSPDRSVIVYLPPSYDTTPTRRYPVVYFLHGNGRTNRTAWVAGYQGLNIKTAMDTMVASGASKEMIIVMPDAHNRYVGSHYVNSTVTGNWRTLSLVRLFSTLTRRTEPFHRVPVGAWPAIRWEAAERFSWLQPFRLFTEPSIR